MFGRRKNRKRRTLGERLRHLWEGTLDLGRRYGPRVCLIALGLAIPWLIVEGYQRAAASSHFDVSTIEVEGLERADRNRLARHMHLLRGENIFDLPVERARAQMASNPWIESVQIERDLPERLVVRVEEHDPAAVLATGRLAFVDREGRVFKTIEGDAPTESLASLPMISGLSRDELRTEHGRRLFEEAMHVVETYREMGLAEARPLSDVHVDPVLGMTLITERPVTEIRLGRRRHRARLEHLESLRDSLASREIEPAYILLDQPMPLGRAVVGPRPSRDDDAATEEG
jgi:cell division protein FtsQ